MHHQHHKFTNDASQDPDFWVCHGGFPTTFARTLLQPFYYSYFYLFRMGNRSSSERAEFFGCIFLSAVVVPYACFMYGTLSCYLLNLFFPSALSSWALSYLFDVLPHQDCHDTPQKNCFKTTKKLVSKSAWMPNWMLSILLQFQNFHHIHHLHPSVPFYRYVSKDKAKEELLKSKGVPVRDLFAPRSTVVLSSTS